MNFDPSLSQIAGRTKIYKDGDHTYVIDKRRRSRLIMADGRKILQISKKIIDHDTNATVKVLISGPICTKTKDYLYSQNIDILVDEK